MIVNNLRHKRKVLTRTPSDAIMCGVMTEKTYDKRHGGPFDRGSADAYYQRGSQPHYYEGGTGSSKMVEEKDMTAADIKAYNYGYDNEDDRKQWI
jgi:hypothetical protein